MRAAISALFLLALAPFGCPDEPAQQAAPEATAPESGDTKQTTSPTPETTPTTKGAVPDAASTTLSADPARSKIGFAVARAPVGHIGHFERYSATLGLVDELPEELEIAVKTASVVADREGLSSHLRSADFFDVDKFPTATFTAEEIVADPEAGPDAFVVRGTMRLHGVRRKLEFPATLATEADHVLGRATLDISAKAFGIAYEGMEEELAEDAVRLEIELVFPRVAEP